MPITSRQFTMVLSTQFHTHTLTIIGKKNTCTKISLGFATLLGNSLKVKQNQCIIFENLATICESQTDKTYMGSNIKNF